MGRERRGMIEERDGKIYARVPYQRPDGSWSSRRRLATNRTHARQLIKEMLREIEDRGAESLNLDKFTFRQWAERYANSHLVAAEYVEGQKVAGLRSVQSARVHVAVFVEYFGDRKIRSISYSDLLRFKSERTRTPTATGRQRSIASVNRELAQLRHCLGVAHREGVILRNPFNAGTSLIAVAAERKRERILTRSEEEALLAACEIPERAHLRPILICALDTGMRQGEIFGLRWKNVDFEGRVLAVASYKGKSRTDRIVAMTGRLAAELERLYGYSDRDLETRVFGIESNCKRSFASACRQAGIAGLRFHDLRHTAATRLVQGHMPLAEIGRILGHSVPSTTYRYTNANAETAHRAAAVLDRQQTDWADFSEILN